MLRHFAGIDPAGLSYRRYCRLVDDGLPRLFKVLSGKDPTPAGSKDAARSFLASVGAD